MSSAGSRASNICKSNLSTKETAGLRAIVRYLPEKDWVIHLFEDLAVGGLIPPDRTL